MEDNTNERLEYLGDSVIALTVSHYRHERYKDQNEGFFDETQNATGIRGHLRKLAVEIGLPSWLTLPLNSKPCADVQTYRKTSWKLSWERYSWNRVDTTPADGSLEDGVTFGRI
jgi:hypothetical protein